MTRVLYLGVQLFQLLDHIYFLKHAVGWTKRNRCHRTMAIDHGIEATCLASCFVCTVTIGLGLLICTRLGLAKYLRAVPLIVLKLKLRLAPIFCLGIFVGYGSPAKAIIYTYIYIYIYMYICGRGSKPMGYHCGVGEFTTHVRTYFSGDSDVHCGYGVLTHSHIYIDIC